MRILMVEHSGRGGMYAYTDALCAGLCSNGADVTVLTSSAWPKSQSPFHIERQFSEFKTKEEGSSRLYWAVDRFSRSMRNIIKRNRFAQIGNFDVVHIQGAGLPLLDQYFLKPLAKNIPVVLTVHDVMSHYERFVSRDSFLKKSLHVPNRLIVHYEDGKKKLIDCWGINPEKIDVIPHGIMPVQNQSDIKESRTNIGLPLDRKIILFFGSIRPNKGLDVLLKSMEKVVRQNTEVFLVIAGALQRGMSFQPYSDIIEKLNLSENVQTYIKFIPDEEVDVFMDACDVVVLPYSKFEAQSGVLLRAYSHKKPVVVSDVGAMGQIVQLDKVGLVVEPEDERSLALAINNVLANPENFKSCYTSELETKYCWEQIGKLTLQSYEKAIDGKSKSIEKK